MDASTLNCQAIEEEIAALNDRISILQTLLDDEPDLSGGTIAHIREQIYEAQLERADATVQLTNCRSDLTVIGIEVTQAIQYFYINGQGTRLAEDNAVPLVARRPLVLRAYVDSKQAQRIPVPPYPTRVTGLLSVSRINSTGTVTRIGDYRPLNSSVLARRGDTLDRRQANDTLNFRLPPAVCQGRLQYSLVVFRQESVVLSQVGGSQPNSLALAGQLSPTVRGNLSFTETAYLNIRLVRIAYRNATRGFDLSPPSIFDYLAATEFARRTFPVPGIVVVGDSVEVYDGDFTSFFASGGAGARGNTGTIFEILTRLRSTEELGEEVHYVALIPGPPANLTGAAGWSISGRQISEVGRQIGEVNGPFLAQELAHDSGFPGHAPCGGPANVDVDYPIYRTDNEASIGEVGYDTFTSKVFDPQRYHDFMSYCGPRWISPYTYEKLFNHFRSALTQLQRTPLNRRMDDGIVLSFKAVGAQIKNISLAPVRITSRPRAGIVLPFTVETLDNEGVIVDAEYARSEDPYRTEKDLEFDAEATLPIRDESHSLRVLHRDEVLWEASLPPARNSSSLRIAVGKVEEGGFTVATGGLRKGEKARVDFSWTSGRTWRIVAEGISTDSFFLDTSEFPGGEDCRLRLVVTQDGRQRQKSSDSFPVPSKPLRVIVVAPQNGMTVRCSDTVELVGLTIGPASHSTFESMNWTSSVDGYLGSGVSLPVQGLSTGRHRITLAADDGMRGEATSHVFINVVWEDADL